MKTVAGLAALLVISAVVATSAAATETIDGRSAQMPPRLPIEKPDPFTATLTPGFGHGGNDQDVGGAKDQVIADDLVVQGGICAGIGCVDNDNFDFITLLMRENNIRVRFDDDSAGSFPANDWQLVINDTDSGGASKFSIEDITGARIPFTVLAGAPTDAVFINALGRVGFRTNNPGLDLHLQTGDTPAVRFDQTNASGFTAQTWDIGANEANFFVRDLTAGSRLSFRIRPGAPTSSLDIAADGDVGIGIASPQARLHVNANAVVSAAAPALLVANPNYAGQPNRFEVDSDGNVAARGTISQLSSRSAKWDFATIDADELLAKVRALPVSTWSYLSSEVKHAGPVAEDFHAAFGLGESNRMIAPSDLAGVALAAVKALQTEVDERDRRIEALERRLLEIESRLPR
jgi:hypothetical protein